MTLTSWEQVTNTLESAIRSVPMRFQRVQPDRWTIHPPGRQRKAIEAKLTEDWLTFEAVPVLDTRDLWDLLQQPLPGLVRLVIDNDHLKFRVDIPVDSPTLGDVLAAALECMNSALTRSTSVRDDLSVGTSVATLAAACEDAGWPVHLREKGLSLTVNLDTPGSIRQAVGGANSRGLTLSTELTILPGLPGAELQRAAAIFLLKTAGAVRLARPFVRLSDGQCVLGFEVTWPGSANAAAVGHALAALSVAAELTARELKALANPLVATLYLKDHDIIHEHAMSALLNLAADLIERAAPDRESAAEYLEAHRQYVDQ